MLAMWKEWNPEFASEGGQKRRNSNGLGDKEA